jgi:multiple sugar transport system permease protein
LCEHQIDGLVLGVRVEGKVEFVRDLYPLTLGLNVWNSVSSSAAGGKPLYNMIALGSLISVLPFLIAFVVLGKYWRGGLTTGATKG